MHYAAPMYGVDYMPGAKLVSRIKFKLIFKFRSKIPKTI